MNKLTKTLVGASAAGMLVASLAACSSPSASGTETGASSAPASSAAAQPEPLASIPKLSGKDTQVTLDADFGAALASLKLTPGVLGSATLTDGVLAFPITGGNVDYYDPAADYRPYVQGEIDHVGSGISLTAGDTVVELTDFVIDPGTSRLTGTVTVNGKVAGEDVFIFNLDGSTLKPLETDSDGNAVLEGTRVLISADAAPLLNDTFGTDAIKPDMLVGIAKITAAAAS
ncbi:MAG: hypothetical protein JWR33_200 [Naasia sp.]|jgi:hypothetical protein|uniref:hypothetical protein n=1 Tax=Naasia sp. TaxID=2546198 RepID=UPI002621B900|nr:hypothetical protein [Naasia sp.]MCU1569459.1 hypothetical protein [Naasia sp.]